MSEELNKAWYCATLEIIERCAAPNMYANARAMLDRAMQAARASQKCTPTSGNRSEE